MVCLLEFGPPSSDVCVFLSLEQWWFVLGLWLISLRLVIQSLNVFSVGCTSVVSVLPVVLNSRRW